MDSFGLDFGSNDILDLGSLGMWGSGTTPVGSSPNGNGLPFSVGTPTGVPSLGDDSFPSLQSGNEDFVFPDSPKANLNQEGSNVKTESGTNHTSAASNTLSASHPSAHGNYSISSNAEEHSNTSGNAGNSSKSPSNSPESSNKSDQEQEEEDEDDAFGDSSYFGDEFAADDSHPTSMVASNESGDTGSDESGQKESNMRSENSNPSGANKHSSSDDSCLNREGDNPASYNHDESVKSKQGSYKQREGLSEKPHSMHSAGNNGFEGSPMLNMSEGSLSMSLPPNHGLNDSHHPMNASAHSYSMSASTEGSSTAASTMSRPHIESNAMHSGNPSVSSAAVPHQHGSSVSRYPQSNAMFMMSQGQLAPGMNAASQAYAAQGYPQSLQMSGPAGQSMAAPTSTHYMQGQPPFRPQPPSNYDEDLMRVKSMMMQHVDLIPPPMEILRISMSQSQSNASMVAGGYMQQRNLGQQPLARGNPQFSQYSAVNPNLVQQTTPTNASDPNRAQLMQRRMSSGPRTPNSSSGMDVPSAWQSENDLPLRRKMIGKIVSLLQARKPDAPPEWIRRLPDMARRLEDSLYRTAKNRDEYGDLATLKTRLQHLAVTMGARAQHKAGGTRPPGVIPAGAAMMHPTTNTVSTLGVGANINPPAHMMTSMSPFNSMGGRMTQQQLMQQQHLMQMQNSQMRQQMTPQQLQHFQAAQMHRNRQYQQQMQQQQQHHHQQVQMQRQASFHQQQQQMQQSHMQRQVPMRQQSNANANQHPQQQRMQSQAYMQQQSQNHTPNALAQTPVQYRNMNTPNSNRYTNDMGLPQNYNDASEFLGLELSQSFLTAEDVQGSDHTMTETGQKRSLSHAQQQLAAAANAAAFKRTKVSGTPDQRRMSPLESPQDNESMQKSVNATGSSKTPPLNTVNAK